MKEFWIEFDIGVHAKISFTEEIIGNRIHYSCHAFLVPRKDMEPTSDDFAFSFSFSRCLSNWENLSAVRIDSAYKQLVDLSEELAKDMVDAIKDFENKSPSHVY
jgi:hypothetical protein